MSAGFASQRVSASAHSTGLHGVVVEVAVELATLESAQIEKRLFELLPRIGEQTGVDVVTLLRFAPSRGAVSASVLHGWSRPSGRVIPTASVLPLLPVTLAKLARGESVHVESLDTMPSDLREEQGVYERLDAEAVFAEPLRVGRVSLGALVLASLTKRTDWHVEQAQGVRAIAALFASALYRLREERGAHAAATADDAAGGTLAEVDRAHILSILRACHWVVAGPHGAAAKLGMKRSTLNFRMHKLGIVRER